MCIRDSPPPDLTSRALADAQHELHAYAFAVCIAYAGRFRPLKVVWVLFRGVHESLQSADVGRNDGEVQQKGCIWEWMGLVWAHCGSDGHIAHLLHRPVRAQRGRQGKGHLARAIPALLPRGLDRLLRSGRSRGTLHQGVPARELDTVRPEISRTVERVRGEGCVSDDPQSPVSYTHLTLPTILRVYISEG